jgi:hypothetical protein
LGEGSGVSGVRDRIFEKLVRNDAFASKVGDLLIDGETVLAAYDNSRAGVVFTDRRLIAVHDDFPMSDSETRTALPYRRAVACAIESSGSVNQGDKLEVHFASFGKVRFEFTGDADIAEVAKAIARASL